MVRPYDREEIPAVHDLAAAPTVREEPGFKQTVFRSIDQLVGFSEITPEKADSEPHTHPYEQTNLLIEGRLDFLVDGERIELTPDDAVAIPPEIPHTSRTVPGETATLLAVWPLREDRIHGTSYQQEFPDL
ncbi:cupin domain-containing protein [Halosegnis sp.]|uniref:cupin domain-containing protein n=1 Tax=Halosegnis sp. TaxID=2864959 RepID=UPI0035D418BB